MWFYIVAGYLILHYFVDTHYFLRLTYYILSASFLSKRRKLLEPTTIYGICLSTDVDMMLDHMNNARYLREFDFGRVDYGIRTRMMPEFMKRGGGFLVCGVSIRYRLTLKIFSLYKVVTTPLWWDDKFMYLEQRIVTISDGIARAVAYVKITGRINMYDNLKELYPNEARPEAPPEDLKMWIQSQELSRLLMKKES